MSLSISSEVLDATQCESLAFLRALEDRRRKDQEHDLTVERLTDDDLRDLARAAGEVGDKRVARAVNAVLAARQGNTDVRVPNFKAFKGVLDAFIKQHVIRGWLYVQQPDGKLYPELMTRVRVGSHGRHEDPFVAIDTICYGLEGGRDGGSLAMDKRNHVFWPRDVVNKRVSDVLTAHGLMMETTELIQAYEDEFRRHAQLVFPSFGEQFRFTGSRAGTRRCDEYGDRKVVNDLDGGAMKPCTAEAETALLAEGVGTVPQHPLVRLFDLKSHEFFWAHSGGLTPYTYDKSLRDKLILPQTHRDLLDVLTGDLNAFVDDIIEGKAAGNIIVCKGQPGVGKTLTAEVYAELIEAPLYAIHAGTLGTTAERINRNLKEVFELAKRWPKPPVLLLDEADVFVATRGDNIEQNAIVAEFLRVLEYFDGLLFLTTNRPNDIDDAVLSRAAAIIDYDAPDAVMSKAVWKVMSKQFQADLADELIDGLVALFPKLPPRDIKNLLKLVLKFRGRFGRAVDLELFRQTAMFRGIRMAPAARAA